MENPRIQTLAGVSLELSSKLKEDMLDAGAHEQAALLLAAFGLRDRLEPLEDNRWALSRMTAHLVLARWITGGAPGLEGRYALTTAYALMNLQTNALGRLHELEKEPSANLHWNRALFARITGDSRPLMSTPASDLCLMEWAERIYANSRCNGDEVAADDFAKLARFIDEKDFNSDLFFALFEGRKPHTVGLGQALYLQMALPLVMRDTETAWDALHETPFKHEDAQQLAEQLNVEPGLCVHNDGHIQILDWGAWSMENQRRLATVYTRSLEFMRHSWGLPSNEVTEAQQQFDKTLANLWLVPCMQEDRGTPEQAVQAYQLFRTRPHLVPPFTARNLVYYLSNKGAEAIRGLDPKLDIKWAGSIWAVSFPEGTLLNVDANVLVLYHAPSFKDAVQRAPFNITLLRMYVEQNKPPPAEARQLLEPLSDYSVFAGKNLAQSLPDNDPAAKEAVYLKVVERDPHQYLNLTRLFQKTDPAKAAMYYEKGRAKRADPVALSNEAEPIVQYYLSIGDRAKAKELAEEAEDCGSSRGFEAMQTFCLKTHDFERGLKAAQDEEERYEGEESVLNYLQKVKEEQPNYHGLDRVYEKKMAEFHLNDIPPYQSTNAPPAKGVLIIQTRRALQVGDILVAINGKAVRGPRDARALRRDYAWRTGDQQNIPMIVFRNGHYLDVKDTTAGMSLRPYPR